MHYYYFVPSYRTTSLVCGKVVQEINYVMMNLIVFPHTQQEWKTLKTYYKNVLTELSETSTQVQACMTDDAWVLSF